ncbi:hypothetical protein FACS189490_05030 [Clostridia bacterium]|nr:hypothetical protein FACS189490_05030 [Clostridia bacterium]
MEVFKADLALREFSLKCLGVRKEKSYYICRTDKGMKNLRPASVPPPRLLFANNVQEALYNTGFNRAERFYPAINGDPYILYDGTYYIAADFYPEMRETDFSDKADVLRATASLAKMHSALRQCGKSLAEFSYDNPEDDNAPDSLFKQNASELNSFKRIVRRQPRLSDFDVMFLKNADFYDCELSAWRNAVNGADYKYALRVAAENGYICHNLLQEESVLTDGKRNFIVNFSMCATDHFINDLSSVIKRHAKKAAHGEAAPIGEIIEAYIKHNALTDAEINALYAPIIFPDKFLSLCQKYYAKKRTWTPAALMTKMKELTDDKEYLKRYVEDFFKN